MRYLLLFLIILLSVSIVSADYVTNSSTNWENTSYTNTREQQAIGYNILDWIPSDAVSHWTFDDGTGTTPNDENTTNTNDGTFVSAVSYTSSSKYGDYAIDIAGVNDYVDCGNDSSLNFTGAEISISAWIYPHLDPTANNMMVVYKGPDSGGAPHIMMYLSSSTNILQFDTSIVGSDWFGATYPTNSSWMNNWTHVVGVKNTTHSVIYINGVKGTPFAGSGNIQSTSLYPLVFGIRGTSLDYDGVIDDVRIYNRTLSQSEINQTRDNYHQSTGNVTHYNDFGTGYQGSQFKFIFNNDSNSFLEGWVSADNSAWYQVTDNVTNNTLINIPAAHKNQTQYTKAILKGNNTSTPEEIEAVITIEASGVGSVDITYYNLNYDNPINVYINISNKTEPLNIINLPHIGNLSSTYCLNHPNGTAVQACVTCTGEGDTIWFNESDDRLPEATNYSINETVPLPGITNVTNGSISSTSQYIDWDVNLTANNQVIYDTGAQGADSTDWSSTWTADHGAANASDSNWSSYAESAGAGTEYLYFNYTIPANANRSHSVLHIKDGDSEANLTIPSACWNATEGTIYVRAAVTDIGNAVTWAADTGSSWTTIRGPNAPNTVYEQEMTFKYTSDWDNSTNAPNITLSGLTASTGYNFVVWSYNIGDITRNASSSIYDFTTSAAVNTSTIIIPANNYGMFNNWTVATNFSNIAANESNDVCYTYYNVTTGEWDSHYPPYSWNSDYVIPLEASVMIYVNAETTVISDIKTPANTDLFEGWNMLYIQGTDNETIVSIIADIGANCTDAWWFNSTAGAYSNTSSDTVQPCQGFLSYITQDMIPWVRSDL